MKRLLIAALLALGTTGTAFACEPVSVIRAAVEGKAQIITLYDMEAVATYNAALGLSIPDTSKAVGMLFVFAGQFVHVGLIEPGDCIKHHTKIPLWMHQLALSGI